MASTRSLGLRRPSALQYLVHEGILESDENDKNYTWTTYEDDEELLTTGTCTVWSQSGVIRRVFRLDREGDQISSAVLTWFASETCEKSTPLRNSSGVVPQILRTHHDSARPAAEETIDDTNQQEIQMGRQKRNSRGLVIVVKQHAYIYFLTGPHHVVNLSFEAERIWPAPQGIILERKRHASLSGKANAGSHQDDSDNLFSSPNLPRTTGAPIHNRESGTSAGELCIADFVVKRKPDKWQAAPHLLTLTGPYAQVGQLLDERQASSRTAAYNVNLRVLDIAEELIYISARDETHLDRFAATRPLIIVITINRTRNTWTVWYASYSDTLLDMNIFESPDHANNKASRSARRRSSMITRAAMNREVNKEKDKRAGRLTARSDRVSDLAAADPNSGEVTDIATLAATEISPGKVKTRDRRAGSFLARAELSTHDQSPNPGVQTPRAIAANLRGKGSGSFMAGMERSGPLTRSAAKARTSFFNSVNEPDDEDVLMADQDEKVNPVPNTRSKVQDVFDDQKCDMILTKASSRKLTELIDNESTDLLTTSDFKVFTLLDPDRPRLGHDDTRAMGLCIMHRPSMTLTESWFELLRVQERGNDPASGVFFVPNCAKNKIVTRRHQHVLDAARLEDGNLVKIIRLVSDRNGDLCLELPQYWVAINSQGHLYDTCEQFLETQDSIRLPLPAAARSEYQRTVQSGDGQSLEEDVHMSQHDTQNTGTTLCHPRTMGRFDMLDSSGSCHSLQINLLPRHPYVRRVFETLSCCLRGGSGFAILYTWWRICNVSTSQGLRQEWDALIVTLMCMVLSVPDDGTEYEISLGRGPNITSTHHADLVRVAQRIGKARVCGGEHSLCDWFQIAVFSAYTSDIAVVDVLNVLHILREEMKLDTLSTERTEKVENTLLPLLTQMASWMGLHSLVGYYMNEDDALERIAFDKVQLVNSGLDANARTPDSINNYSIVNLMNGIQHPFQLVSELRLHSGSDPKLLDVHLFPRLAALIGATHAPDGRFPKPALERFVSDSKTMESAPEVMTVALRVLSRLWLDHGLLAPTPSLIRLFNRESSMTPTSNLLAAKSTAAQTQSIKNLSLRSLAASKIEPSVAGSAPLNSTRPHDTIFMHDRRTDEVALLLDYARQATGEYKPRVGSTDKQFLDQQKAHARLIYQRTISIAAGRALLRFRARHPSPTEKVRIATFNTSCLMMPSGQTFNAEVMSEDKSGWAYFHGGVSAGLNIGENAPGLDSSWIILNKPDEPGVRHAGLLLGLGLNNQLKSMPRWLIFRYLTPKHDMTTIGLLLGISASRLGSADQMMTKILSVNVPRLLPAGATELNLSPLIQTAGLMSIGLLYYNTQHRRMSEILLSEVEHVDLEDSVHTTAETPSPKNEGYRLAAGFALGLINVGCGRNDARNNLRALNGMNVMDRLLKVATAPRNADVVHILDQATAGATIAIALIFIRAEDAALARRIGVPDGEKDIEHIRPDILLLRTLAQHLIMWDEIEASMHWIWRSLPACITANRHVNSFLDVPRPLGSENLPLYNILTGLCWSVALKYAGSGNTDAKKCILTVYDLIALYAKQTARTYDEKLTRETLQRCQHHLILSAATVMSGSGDLDIFRRLRAQYGHVADPSVFGLHQATMMAMGTLFLGGGKYAFGRTLLQTAVLIIAFYPIFPKDAADNRAHLQAFRHFWAFAAEARCIIVRDVDTMAQVPISLDVLVSNPLNPTQDLLWEPHQGHAAPMLLPDLASISKIVTTSPDYEPFILDLKNNDIHRQAFKKNQTILVRRKQLLSLQAQSYDETYQAELASQNRWHVDLDPFHEAILRPVMELVQSLTRQHIQDIFRNSDNLGRVDKIDSTSADDVSKIASLLDPRTTPIDDALMLLVTTESTKLQDMQELRQLFEWVARTVKPHGDARWLGWISEETISILRAALIARGAAYKREEQDEIGELMREERLFDEHFRPAGLL